VGAFSAAITVSASPAAVQTGTAEVSSTVSRGGAALERKKRSGRGIADAGSDRYLAPAAMGLGGFNTSNSLNVNGQGSSGSLYTVDGIWNLNTIYSLPWFAKSTGWKRAVVGGWKLSGVTTMRGGSSLTMGMNLASTGLASRPNLIGRVTYPKTIQQWFSTGAFVKPASGFYGNA
jgi:hypothetical protein